MATPGQEPSREVHLPQVLPPIAGITDEPYIFQPPAVTSRSSELPPNSSALQSTDSKLPNGSAGDSAKDGATTPGRLGSIPYWPKTTSLRKNPDFSKDKMGLKSLSGAWQGIGPALPEKGAGRVCVLSIDGGGMRGAIPARILCRLEELLQQKSRCDARLADYFDIVGGTSVGGLLAVLILTPDKTGRPKFTAADAAAFLENYGALIFPQRKPESYHALRNVLRPKYSARKFEDVLRKNLANEDGSLLTLRDLLRPCVIPAFDLKAAKPLMFLAEAAKASEELNFTLVDVCRSTTAAPTLFKPHPVTATDNKSTYLCVDGAVIANNPSLATNHYVDTNQDLFPCVIGRKAGSDGILLPNKLMLSLGTGEQSQTFTYQEVRRWGQLAWVAPLIDIMFNGTSHTVDYMTESLFRVMGEQHYYHRIQVRKLPGKTIVLDNPDEENLRMLFKLADEVLQQKVVSMNSAGFHVELDETNEERLSRLADELILEHRARMFRPNWRTTSAFGRHNEVQQQNPKHEIDL